MAPITPTSPSDLQAAMGYLVDLGADDPAEPGPGTATATASASASASAATTAQDATAATIGRAVQPLTDADLEDLQRDPALFVRNPRGQALIREVQDDFQRLADLADQAGLSSAGHDIRDFCRRLQVERSTEGYWLELFTAGRHHLARVVAGMADAEIPLDERRTLMLELSRGLTHCGLRVRVELQRADRGLFGYRGTLPQTVRRAFEQCRDDLIRRVVAEHLGEDARRPGLNVHRLVNVLQGLSLESSRLPLEFMTPAQFDAILRQCRRELPQHVGPNPLATRLADECLEAVRAGLPASDEAPLNLADSPQHLNRLHQLVGDLSARYGPLRPASFIELDDDALPRLAEESTLIALDIRRGMSSHRLAPPPVEDEVMVIGQGADRLSILVTDRWFSHVVLGDPALEERHPIRRSHVDRIVAEGSMSWTAESDGPTRCPAVLRLALLRVGLDQMDQAALQQVSPRWIDDMGIAQQFSTRIDDPHYASWLTAVARSSPCDNALTGLMRVISSRGDAASALSILTAVSPDLLVRIWPSLGRTWLNNALTQRLPTQCNQLLLMMEAAVPHMAPAQRRDALTLPAAAATSSPMSFGVLSHYLHILSNLAERGLLTAPLVGELLRRDGPVGQVLFERFPFDMNLNWMLAPLKRLHRCGVLNRSDLTDLLSTPVDDDTRLPHAVDAIGEKSHFGVVNVMKWALDPIEPVFTPDTIRALVAPVMTPLAMEEPLQRLCSHGEPAALLAYLEGMLRAWRQHLVTPDRITQLLRTPLRMEGDVAAPLLVVALMENRLGLVNALLNWLKKAMHAKALDGEGLLRVIDDPGDTEFAVLGTALQSDRPGPVRDCIGVLDAALSLSLLTPAAFGQVLSHAVHAGQTAALLMHAERPPAEGAAAAAPTELHALDVLWHTLLPILMSGRCDSGRVTELITGRSEEQASIPPRPEDILLGAYESLVDGTLISRAVARERVRDHEVDIRLAAGTAALPPAPPAPIADDLLMRLLVCNSGPERTPLLNVALRGGAPALVRQVMGIAITHLQAGRLSLPELTMWWQATGDSIEPAVHVALNSLDAHTVRAYLEQLLTAFEASSERGAPGGLGTDASGRSTMLLTLLGMRNQDLLTPAQAAVRLGAEPLLALYLDAVMMARQFRLLSNAAVTELLASESPTASAPEAHQPAQAACQARLDECRARAVAQGWATA